MKVLSHIRSPFPFGKGLGVRFLGRDERAKIASGPPLLKGEGLGERFLNGTIPQS